MYYKIQKKLLTTKTYLETTHQNLPKYKLGIPIPTQRNLCKIPKLYFLQKI